MSAAPLPGVGPQEYLRHERLASERSEYHDGTIVAMSGTSRAHSRIVTNLARLLDTQLLDGPCNTYTSELRVSVRGGKGYYYPDVVVSCGEEEFEDGQFDTLTNPVLIIEVLSPSTEVFDKGDKFFAYKGIVSLREYVLVSQTTRRVEVFRRLSDGTWIYNSWPFADEPVTLESISCTLTLDQIYNKVDRPPGPGPNADEPHAG